MQMARGFEGSDAAQILATIEDRLIAANMVHIVRHGLAGNDVRLFVSDLRHDLERAKLDADQVLRAALNGGLPVETAVALLSRGIALGSCRRTFDFVSGAYPSALL